MHRTLVSSFVLASALACILPMTAGCSSGDVSVGKSDQDLGLEQDTPPQACTTELKTCPDGSQVGRGGPNCEFAPCPPQACTTELKTCPDGSQVGRGGPNCEFAPCPR